MEEIPAPGGGRSGRLLDYSDLRGQQDVTEWDVGHVSLPANLPGFLLFSMTSIENTCPLQKQGQGPEQLMA